MTKTLLCEIFSPKKRCPCLNIYDPSISNSYVCCQLEFQNEFKIQLVHHFKFKNLIKRLLINCKEKTGLKPKSQVIYIYIGQHLSSHLYIIWT